MSFASIVILLVVCLILYYLGMIVYDMNKERFSSDKSLDEPEQEIDISNEVTSFESTEVSLDTDGVIQEKIAVNTNCPFTPSKLSECMSKVALDGKCKELSNVSFKCLAAS